VLTVSTGTFEFNFEFGQYKPVTGPTGPVIQNRWPAVWVNQSEKKTWRRHGRADNDARDRSTSRRPKSWPLGAPFWTEKSGGTWEKTGDKKSRKAHRNAVAVWT